MSLLARDRLNSLVRGMPPLVDKMIDPNLQVQPNGIELSLQEVKTIDSFGSLGFDNSERKISESTSIPFKEDGWIHLSKGCYKIIFNEIVNIPNDIVAIAKPRSSLLRCGATIETAVWDAGYSGRSESLLLIHNEKGLRLKRNARMVQLLFFSLGTAVKEGYSGAYQNENVKSPANVSI